MTQRPGPASLFLFASAPPSPRLARARSSLMSAPKDRLKQESMAHYWETYLNTHNLSTLTFAQRQHKPVFCLRTNKEIIAIEAEFNVRS